MTTINSTKTIHETSQKWKREGHRVGLVPTMGCLHEGHLSLVRLAKKHASKVIVSIFVNPLQFGPNEDFAKYPRTLEADLEKLSRENVDLVFNPELDDLYPKGFATRISVSGLPDTLCGKSRPGHFSGVTTVCLKLFESTASDIAVFGEKDFQQLRIIQRMTEDLNLPIVIVPHPIVREADGLALSSRNRYLSDEERQWALKIPQSISAAQEMTSCHPTNTVGDIKRKVHNTLTSVPLVIDYIEIASENDLNPASDDMRIRNMERPRLFVAVKAGTTRLIDNRYLGAAE